MYVIKRLDQGGGYLARHPGSGKAYTNKLERARLFMTRRAAEEEAAARVNEQVVHLLDLFR